MPLISLLAEPLAPLSPPPDLPPARGCPLVHHLALGGSSGAGPSSLSSPDPDLRRRRLRRRRLPPSEEPPSSSSSESSSSASDSESSSDSSSGPVAVLVVVAGLVAVGSALLTAPAATTTAAPAPPAVGRPIGLRRRPRRCRPRRTRRSRRVLVARRSVGVDRLRRDEQRHVLRSLGRSPAIGRDSSCPGDGSRRAADSRGLFGKGLANSRSRTRSASSRSTPECTVRIRPSSALSASSTRLLVVPSVRASEWTLRRSGNSSCRVGSSDARSADGAPSTTYSPQAPGRVLSTRPREGFAMCPGHFSRACDGLAPSGSFRTHSAPY